MMSQANRKDDATIRVSNLPESMSETDMQELCMPFGKIERIFLAKDRYALSNDLCITLKYIFI
jgi:RNA recognition motif-containing protein